MSPILPTPKLVQRVYVSLTFFNTLAAAFIWGINTLFLLDAGLSNLEAFAANAFFTVGQVVFEIPTGIVADRWGRRVSYIIGAVTLSLSTALYLLIWNIQGPFWMWAASSMLLGLGFTFFSGAGEAWLVDALKFSKYKGSLESVFAKAQIATGIAMLTGSVSGGLVAQATNLGVPYIIRAVLLGITIIVAYFFMKDWGFKPRRGATVAGDVKQILDKSLDHGLRNPPVRWVMLAAPFGAGVGFYVFYALQPYLLELYGDSTAYSIAGLVAAIVAGAQIAGGLAAPHIRRIFSRRTSAMIAATVLSTILLVLLGFTDEFAVAIGLIILWGLTFAAITPIQQTYLNKHIPSQERATVLSFASLMGSSGGVFTQPVLGRIADVWSYSTSYAVAGTIQILALPFLLKARASNPKHDATGPGEKSA